MTIKENIFEIEEDIKKYSQSNAKLLCVTKTIDISRIKEAYDIGYKEFGENKVQELLDKKEKMPKDINWHLIGHLQTNKVNKIVGEVSLIHSVDSIKLLKKINNRAYDLGISQDILLQVNISKEDTKSGFYKEELEEVLKEANDLNSIKIRGFMTMAPYSENPENIRWVFKELKKEFDKFSDLSYNNIKLDYLSMGMTNDYKIALEEGANIIRVGSKIFGKREYNNV